MSERRESARVDLLGNVTADVLVPQPTRITEISRTGMQVETAFPLRLDSLHEFRLTLGDQSMVVKGRVVHSRITDVDRDAVTYQSGIEFVEPSDGVVASIGQYLEGILRQRGGCQ